METEQGKKPGDEVRPGTARSGENLCPACSGKGEVNGKTCSECSGAGTVTTLVGTVTCSSSMSSAALATASEARDRAAVHVPHPGSGIVGDHHTLPGNVHHLRLVSHHAIS
jgi:RecJ-like exonuclease